MASACVVVEVLPGKERVDQRFDRRRRGGGPEQVRPQLVRHFHVVELREAAERPEVGEIQRRMALGADRRHVEP